MTRPHRSIVSRTARTELKPAIIKEILRRLSQNLSSSKADMFCGYISVLQTDSRIDERLADVCRGTLTNIEA